MELADTLMWVNGSLVPANEATVSARDHGLVVGDGAFEAIKLVHGRAFALTRHLDRLDRTVAGMELPPVDRGAIEHAISEVLEANAAALIETHDVMRITYTAGPGPLGSPRGDGPATLVIAVSPEGPPPPFETAVITVPWRRNEFGALTGLKTTSYAENAMAVTRATAAGATEALFANTAGMLCEGTGSNVFLALDGQLVTPTLESGCLAGVTRALVLEWTDAIELDVPLDDLARAPEVFLTSTRRDVQAVTSIDGRPVGDGIPGPLTLAAAAAFRAGQNLGLDP